MKVSSLPILRRLLQRPQRKDWPLSDHWDGQKFFNPGVDTAKNLKLFLKWQLRRRKQSWPRRVEYGVKYRAVGPRAKSELWITFVNHSTFLIEWQGYNILTDPIWSERTSPISSVGPKRVHDPGIPFDLLPRIDLVLVSHNHYDHLDLATLLRLEKAFGPLFLVAVGDAPLLREQGIRKVEEMDWHQERKLGPLQILFTPAQHWSGRGVKDRFSSLWGGFILTDGERRIFFAGDSGYGPHFSQIHEKYGAMDLALLPIGAYEPRWFMEAAHMNPRDAVLAHRDLEAKLSVGMHFGTFQLTDEGIDQPLRDLREALEQMQILPHRFVTLLPGESRKV